MDIRPTEKQLTVTGITINLIVKGKDVELWINGDKIGLMQQLGMIPS